MDPLKTPASTETKLHFLDYWRIIRIRKAVILLVFLLVVITATIVTFILPEAYASKARIKVERDVTDVPGVSGQPSFTGVYDPYFIQTEFEVIQSERILDTVIKNLDLNTTWASRYNQPKFRNSETRSMLRRMIDLRPVRNTSLIDVTVYSEEKEEAKNIANMIAEVYSEYRRNQRKTVIEGGLNAFKKELSEQETLVKDQEEEVERLRKKYKVVDTEPQSTQPGSSLGPLNIVHYNSIMIEAETTLVKQRTLLNKLKELTPSELEEALPTAAPDSILTQLLQDKIAAEAELARLRITLGDSNPEVVSTQTLLNNYTNEIAGRVKGIIQALDSVVESLEAQVKDADEKLTLAKAKDLAIEEETRPYYQAKSELERKKRFAEVLALRTAQESVERIMPTTLMVEVIEHAEVGLRPVRPNKPLNIALGIIIGLVVGVGLAFFIEYLDTSVKTIDDVERTLQSPVLGVIPQNVGYLLEEGAESPHAEAYRVLRTNVLFSRKDDKLNTIAVVSAGAGEGKSTTVCNLATVFAQCGQRVVMVDSDLRRPTLHKILRVANSIGLTNYLLKQNTLEEVIQTTAVPSLDFLASGKLPSSSLGILSSAQMKDLITELKQRYDYVFFDSPPIMGVSDASILASEVDMTLQVIQYRRYPQPMNIRAKQLIEKVGGNLIGIVLNNINMSQDESYYYYGGYYHDYYSKNEDEESGGQAGDKPRTDVKRKS